MKSEFEKLTTVEEIQPDTAEEILRELINKPPYDWSESQPNCCYCHKLFHNGHTDECLISRAEKVFHELQKV